MNYAKHYVNSLQTERALSNQVENNAGGFVFELSDYDKLRRFLILGTEGNTYYASEREMTRDNATLVEDLWLTDPKTTAATIVDISVNRRAPKQDPAIFALALGAASQNPDARRLALLAMSSVCTIGTHLFQFVKAVTQMRGWGRALRRAVADWYLRHNSLDLQLVKYQNRHGWSHADLIKLSHPVASQDQQHQLFRWALGKEDASPQGFAEGFDLAKKATSVNEICDLIREYSLTREMIPTHFLNSPQVWFVLLERMPSVAMLRNLGNMSKCGLLVEGNWDTVNWVVAKLGAMKRVHPIAVLSAYNTYSRGCGVRGSGEWDVVPVIKVALDNAFYNAFGEVLPTGKRIFVGLDVSGSMAGGEIAGVAGLTPAVGSAAMCMLHLRTEKNVMVRGFTAGAGSYYRGTNELTDLRLTAKDTIEEVVSKTSRHNFGATDCALPMLYCLEKRIPVDAFIVYTDNETWAGNVHPYKALQQYRSQMGINAKLIVVGMTATDFTIADPNDAGSLDVVGFDTATPNLINDFISNKF